MAGQGRIANAHFRDPRKGGLKRGQKLTAELTVQLIPGVGFGDIAADIGIEQHGVADPIAVFAEAADGNVHVNKRPLIHHPEGHGAGGAVFVAHKLFDVEIIDPLILGRLAAKSKALAHGFEGIHQTGAEIAGENGGLRGAVVCKFAGFGADFHHFALLHNHHALTVCHRNDGAVGNNIVRAAVGAPPSGALLALQGQHGFGDGFTVEVFLPLVGQHAACCTHCCFDKSHMSFLLFLIQ